MLVTLEVPDQQGRDDEATVEVSLALQNAPDVVKGVGREGRENGGRQLSERWGRFREPAQELKQATVGGIGGGFSVGKQPGVELSQGRWVLAQVFQALFEQQAGGPDIFEGVVAGVVAEFVVFLQPMRGLQGKGEQRELQGIDNL